VVGGLVGYGLVDAQPQFLPYLLTIASGSYIYVAMAGGAVHDPVGALLLCASGASDYTVVHGRVIVRQGQLSHVDLPRLVERHNRHAIQLAHEV